MQVSQIHTRLLENNTFVPPVTAGVTQYPQNSTVILGEPGKFSCSSVSESIVWNVTGIIERVIDAERITNNQDALALLEAKGVFINATKNGNTHTSELTVIGDLESNFTMIQCAVADAFSNHNFSGGPIAVLRVIGMQYRDTL